MDQPTADALLEATQRTNEILSDIAQLLQQQEAWHVHSARALARIEKKLGIDGDNGRSTPLPL